MRDRIVDCLDRAFGVNWFDACLPTAAIVQVVAIAAVVLLLLRRSHQVGLDRRATHELILGGAVGALVGARVIYAWLYNPALWRDPRWLLTPGGTASWGVYAGAFGGAAFVLCARRRPVLRHLDVLAASILLGTAIGRVGCFLAGCDFGSPSEMAWAVRYPTHSPAFAAQVGDHLLDPREPLSLAVHPNQLYLSANALLLLGGISWIWRRQRHRPGRTLGVWVVAYSASRFFLEAFRAAPEGHSPTSMNPSQLASLGGCALGLSFLGWLAWHQRRHAAQHAREPT